MSFSKRSRKNTPQCYTKPLDSLKNWNNRFFWVDERVFPTVVDRRTNTPKDGMPAEGTYSVEAVRALDTHRTPIQKQPEMLLCLAGISRRYYLRDEVYGSIQLDSCPKFYKRKGSSHGGKSLAAIQLGLASTASMPEDAPTGVSDLDPLFFADPPARPSSDVAQSSPGIAAVGDPESKNASSPAEVGSPGGVYRPEWGFTNGSLLDTPEACQDLVDQYNVNLARQVAMGSQMRLRFEQEAKLLKKSVSQVTRRYKRIQARELEIKNLEALLETEANMKKAAEDKSVASLKEQISREEKMKATFEEFKRYEDDRVERRCAELDARLDSLSIDFDEELYSHMLTAIAGRRWVIGHGLRLTAMKCGESLDMRQAFTDVVSARITKDMSEGLRHGVEHGQAQRNVKFIEAYDPEAEAKFVVALQALKDLKYPLLDQFEG
nr:hypothetical protein [Tanacetum cinerariifolium]